MRLKAARLTAHGEPLCMEKGSLHDAKVKSPLSLASRIANAVAVRRIGTPFDVTEAVSNVKSYGEGPVMICFRP